MADPYALNDDGTAKDPAAFRAALKADPAKLEAIQKEPEVADIVLGSDDHAFQELIKSVYHVSGWAGVHQQGPDRATRLGSSRAPLDHTRRRRRRGRSA